MKYKTLFYTYIISAGFIAMLSACSDNPENSSIDQIETGDSTETVDSTMSTNVKDPSTAFPLPPVTGTQKDSSYADTMKHQ